MSRGRGVSLQWRNKEDGRETRINREDGEGTDRTAGAVRTGESDKKYKEDKEYKDDKEEILEKKDRNARNERIESKDYRKRVIHYFSYQYMQKDVEQYGYSYSLHSYIVSFLVVVVAMVLVGIVFRLCITGIVILVITAVMCLPKILRIQFAYKNKAKVFSDVDLYIHQMAYSFKRNPKINLALQDTAKVVSKSMRKQIEQALKELQYGVSGNIYREALSVIQNEYNCSRVVSLHEFLICIEEKGGQHQNSIDVLLWDFDNWTRRVYKHQKDMRMVKRTSEIGLILSMFLSLSTTIISMLLRATTSMDMRIDQEGLYQISAVGFLIISIFYYMFLQIRFNKDWIKQERPDHVIRKDLELARIKSLTKIRLNAWPLFLGCLIFGMIFCYLQLFIGTVCSVILMVFLYYVPYFNVMSARKRIEEDVYISFTEWLRDVAINLQDEPVLAAIEDTYEHCPVVLKDSLTRFIAQIEQDPSDVTPYYEYLNEFHIVDISSTIRTLYSISLQEEEDMDMTINSLIRKNCEMIEKHDQMVYEDNISIMRFSEYIPTMFVSVKIAVDMMLVITNYL